MKDEKIYRLDTPKNVTYLLGFFYGCCLLLVILEFVINRHVSHRWESLWAFYPIYGFVGCVTLVVVATWLRTFLMRDQDYYTKQGIEKRTTANSGSDDASPEVTINTGDENVDE